MVFRMGNSGKKRWGSGGEDCGGWLIEVGE